MNLLEARKSGRRYKRPNWERWWSKNDCEFILNSEIDADDYILEPEPKKKIKLYAYIGYFELSEGMAKSSVKLEYTKHIDHAEGYTRLPMLDQEIEE